MNSTPSRLRGFGATGSCASSDTSNGRVSCIERHYDSISAMASGFDGLADVVRGATFDDFLLRPQYSVIERRDPSVIDLSCRFSTSITLKRPLVSANMDTVTRAPMAIVQAEEGGLGIIDRGFRNGDIEPQVREVEKGKRMQHVIIRDPYAVTPQTPLADAVAMMRRTRAGTLVVVDQARKLKGLLTERDVRFVN